MSSDDRKTDTVTAFLSVYRVTRHYGGPEEGGWWYDAWEHTGASFPFRATQEFYETTTEDAEDATHFDEKASVYMKWEPDGNPVPADHAQKILVDAAKDQFTYLYGDPEAKEGRYSVNGGADVKFLYELSPGQNETKGKPRYE